MAELFEESHIRGMSLCNRFIRSATWEGMAAADGACTPALIQCMQDLAQGAVGLIVAGYAYVEPAGRCRMGQLGLYDDALVEGLRRMTAAVHRFGGRIAAQLAHGGIFADPEVTGRTPQGPSHVPDLVDAPHAALSGQEIAHLVDAFGRAARRCMEAGFDAVQIHGAHGYLHSQFLSPAFNRRTDAYGGDLQRRARFVRETLEAVRHAVGPEFPVMIKMNARDYLPGGLSLPEAVQVGKWLQQWGIDAIEVSGGTLLSGRLGPVRPGIDRLEKEAYFREEARAFKEAVAVPVILVGGIRSLEVAERIIGDRDADYIALSRPLIREPGLIRRWAAGDRRQAACISDTLCRQAALEGQGIHCVVERRQGSA